MFRRPTQKEQLFKRVAISIVAVTAIIIIVTVTIFFILGYRLDGGSGRLQQGALVQVDSRPNGADVWINGEHAGSKTGMKKMVEAGDHTFSVTKDGYEDWSRSLTLTAGTLTWLDYVRLVPKDRTPRSVASYTTLMGAKASPDRKTYIIQQAKETPIFDIVDLRSEDVKTKQVTIPTTALTEGDDTEVSSYRIVRWDEGGRYVLVVETVNKKDNWIVVDTQQVAQSRSVTRTLSVELKDAQFIGTDGRTLYGHLTDGSLRKLDLGNETLSRALVSNVSRFTFNHDTKTVSYIASPRDGRQTAGVYRDGDAQGYLVRDIEGTSGKLSIATGLYHGGLYIAVSEGNLVTVLKGAYPRTVQEVAQLETYDTFTTTDSVDWLSFNDKGAYLVALTQRSFVGYEIEHKRERSVALDQSGVAFEWLDTAYLWSDAGGTLTLRDFDGSNKYSLASVAKGFDVTLSQNGRFLYFITESDGVYALQRITMQK